MNVKFFTILTYFILSFKLCEAKKYSNYCLIQVTPTNAEHLKYLRSLETERYMDISFCEKPFKTGIPINVIVSPTDIALFRERANHFNLEYTVLMTDIQRAFNNQSIITYQSLRPDTFTFDNFHVLDDIYQWLSDLHENKSYPVTHLSIGKSIEGRDISVVNVNLSPEITKPKVIIEGGIHGYEWASIVFVTYLISELSHAEDSDDPAWRRLARIYDWYLVPVANPDGYDYTHKNDRLWRKNRNVGTGNLFGVDLNRNFDHSFGKFASSNDPINDNYCGSAAFSEPESRALSFLVTSNHPNLKYYFAIHAYGQRIIIPYEDRVQHLENFGEMESYSRQAVRKLYQRYRVKYTLGTTYDTMGARLSGTSTSWAKKKMRVKYVYTLQLRDNGTYGFALPCDQLLPMCRESRIMMTDLMTAKPRFVKALYEDDANIEEPYLPLVLLGFFVAFI